MSKESKESIQSNKGKKQEKVDEINKFLQKSDGAKKYGAEAKILPDGRIEYTMLSRGARPYKMKASFREIIMTLDGKDLRYLYQKYGGGKK